MACDRTSPPRSGAQALDPDCCDFDRARAHHLHDPHVAEDAGGIHLQQGGTAGASGPRSLPHRPFRQRISRLDGEQQHPRHRRGRAQHRRVLPRRLCDRTDEVRRAGHALRSQHRADGGAAGRHDRAALRALHAAFADQHLSGRDPDLCRPDHALFGLSADELLPHPAAGTLRIGAHRWCRRSC